MNYMIRLISIESKLDWILATHNQSPTKLSSILSTLRLHLTHTPLNQIWQSTANEEITPTWNLEITGEIINPITNVDIIDPTINFTRYVNRIVIETDRDPLLHGGPTTKDWIRPPTTLPLGQQGLSLSFPSTTSTILRISIYLDHQPTQYAILPDLANLLNLHFADPPTLIQAFWTYIKLNQLQEEERRSFKTDARLKPFFGGQDRVPLHHLPEYINRFLAALPPVQITHTVR